MKQIKLSDYSLINVKELDERINYLADEINLEIGGKSEITDDAEKIGIELATLLEIKQSLIPSEKLAEVAFDAGIDKGKHLQANNYFDAPLDKQEFLNSEINLD